MVPPPPTRIGRGTRKRVPAPVPIRPPQGGLPWAQGAAALGRRTSPGQLVMGGAAHLRRACTKQLHV